jgi:biotin operon repressor
MMVYTRSQAIEKRLRDILDLVRRERQSTPTLARALGISQPTVSRCLTALRQRGYLIRAVKDEIGWSYELEAEPAASASGHDSLR